MESIDENILSNSDIAATRWSIENERVEICASTVLVYIIAVNFDVDDMGKSPK